MRILYAGALAVLALAVPARGASYDELNVGIMAYVERDWDAAILHLDKAIAANDLIPSLMLPAYKDRATAHAVKHQWPQAIADFTAALAIKPDTKVLAARARVYEANSDPVHAHADDMAISAMAPSDIVLQRAAGAASLRLGYFKDAAEAFSRSFGSPDDDPYMWLLLQIAIMKDGKPVSADKAETFPRRWPGPIVSLFLGKSTPEEVLAAAQKDGGKRPEGVICEGDVYVGEWRLLHNDAGGRSNLEKAVAECPKDYLELGIAQSEIKK